MNVIVTMLFVDLDPAWQTKLPNWTGNVIGPGGGALQMMAALFALPIRGASEQGRPETDPLGEPDVLYFTLRAATSTSGESDFNPKCDCVTNGKLFNPSGKSCIRSYSTSSYCHT